MRYNVPSILCGGTMTSLLPNRASAFAVAGFCAALAGGHLGDAWAEEPGQTKGMTVTVVRAARHCFPDQVKLSGYLAAAQELLVKPEADGMRVAEILVENGQEVSEGEPLARLVRADDPNASPVSMKAPRAGVVSVKAARVGALAPMSGEPLFGIAVGGEYSVDAETPASLFAKIAQGQRARVTIAGHEEAEGRVKEKSFSVSPMTQLGRVRISLPPSASMQAGAFAKVVVFAGESCGMTAPLSAILYGPGGAYLQVVSDGRIETRRVRVGFLSGNTVEIREGVEENDIVVAKAGAFLREGDSVRQVLIDGYDGRSFGLAGR
jgi:HlyD family secretion protein